MTADVSTVLRLLLAVYTRELKTAFFLALSGQPALQIVATATNTAELLSYSRAFQPDVIILEWELPGRPVVDVLPTLAQADHPADIFVISNPSSHPQIQDSALSIRVVDDPDGLLDALAALHDARDPAHIEIAEPGGL